MAVARPANQERLEGSSVTIEYERIGRADAHRTVGTCGCPEKDCMTLEVAQLKGMGLPHIEKCLLRCILCGSTYFSREEKNAQG